MYAVYILYSQELNKFYIGFTGDAVHIRLAKHLAHHKGFTSKAKDWKIVHVENYENKQEAMMREKQLKNWKSKTRIQELINRSSYRLQSAVNTE